MKSVVIRFAVFDFGQGSRRFFLSHAVTFKGDTVGVVDDPVEDGICDGWLAEHARVQLFLNGSYLASRSLTRIIFFLGIGLRC